jgi:hypothetical protein
MRKRRGGVSIFHQPVSGPWDGGQADIARDFTYQGDGEALCETPPGG